MAPCVGADRTAKWRPVWELALTAIMVLICGIVGLASFITDLVRKGPSRMFSVRQHRVRPQILDDAKYGTHHFVTLENSKVRLHCVASGPPDKPLMIFVHGFPEFWYSWRHQLLEFSKNYRVVAYDLKGLGESDAPLDTATYTLDQLGDDLEQLITALGYERCTLVGHDWGGGSSWSCAVLHSHRIEKLIVLNSPHPLALLLPRHYSFSQLKKTWYGFLFQLPLLPRLMLRADDCNWPEEILTGRAVGCANAFTSEDIAVVKYIFSKNVDRAVAQGKLSVPTLIIWGTNDGALDMELAELSTRYVQQCTVRYIEGASHWVHEEEPQRVNQLIHQFMNDEL